MHFRDAGSADAEAIAALHASSWRSAYQGILAADFLEREVDSDRRLLWRERLSSVRSDRQWVRVVVEGAELAGFVCVFLDEDEQWGALLDNLHVRPDVKGRGIGRQLMADAAAWVTERRPESALHLWVYETNTAARRFYERIGGMPVERVLHEAPDGHDVPAVRYVWEKPATLLRL